MNFVLSMLEGMLGLSDDEKAAIEPCLPALKTMIDQINDVWPQVQQAADLVASNKTLVDRMLDDVNTILPNASALVGGSVYIDVGGTLSKVKDLQTVVQDNPKTTQDVRTLYAAIEPVIVSISQEWPSVAPAYNTIVVAAKRKGYSLGSFLDGTHRSFLAAFKEGRLSNDFKLTPKEAGEQDPSGNGWA